MTGFRIDEGMGDCSVCSCSWKELEVLALQGLSVHSENSLDD